MKVLTVTFSILLFGSSLFGQELSEQKLIDLKKAGVTDALIIKQVEKDGISFTMDADTTIGLKKVGFSEDVLGALLTIGSKKVEPQASDPIKTLYSQGKYAELCDYLTSQLQKTPENYRFRAILIGTLLRINRRSDALAELDNLKASASKHEAKPYFDRASAMISKSETQDEVRSKLLLALQDYSYANADSLIDQLQSSPAQKAILHMVIDSYAAQFDSARARDSQLKSVSSLDQKNIDAAKNSIAESERAYGELMDKADYYIHGARFYEPCSLLPPISLADYGDLVSKLSQVAPLSPKVLDLVFHAVLISSQYDDLQTLGDKILAAKGNIRVPFEAYRQSYDVVIDKKLRTLSTQSPLSNHSQVLCAYTKPAHVNTDNWSKVIPFNLSFDQVTGISQKVPLKSGIVAINNEYDLSFEPAGAAPWIGLHSFVFTSEGAEGLLLNAKNLGMFILHVIGNPNIKTQLADPGKANHRSGFGDALIALYGATNGQTPLGRAAMQVMADQKASSDKIHQEQQATWQAMLARNYSDLLNGNAFESLDKLIEVTQ